MKKLKTNGNKISNYQIAITPMNDKNSKVLLLVTAEAVDYSYDIHRDIRHPDLAVIKRRLDLSLGKAITEFLNVEISEYKERDYLFIHIQSIGQEQYTGRRTA